MNMCNFRLFDLSKTQICSVHKVIKQRKSSNLHILEAGNKKMFDRFAWWITLHQQITMEVTFPRWAKILRFTLKILILNIGWMLVMSGTHEKHNKDPLCPPYSGRTRSWSVPTSTTTTATSPTAPSAVEAGKCLCVATTTAVGQYNTVYTLLRFGDWQAAVASFCGRE